MRNKMKAQAIITKGFRVFQYFAFLAFSFFVLIIFGIVLDNIRKLKKILLLLKDPLVKVSDWILTPTPIGLLHGALILIFTIVLYIPIKKALGVFEDKIQFKSWLHSQRRQDRIADDFHLRKNKNPRTVDQLVSQLINLSRSSEQNQFNLTKEKLRTVITNRQTEIMKLFFDWDTGSRTRSDLGLLDGSWGSGKSVMANLAIDEMKKISNHMIFLYQDLSEYSSSTEAIQDVINELFVSIAVNWEIKVPRSLHFNFEANISASPNIKLTYKPEDNNRTVNSNLINYINEKYISFDPNSTNKLVIVLDELERLDADEILSLMHALTALRQLDFVRILIVCDEHQLYKRLAMRYPAPADKSHPQFTWKAYFEKYFEEQTTVRATLSIRDVKEIYDVYNMELLLDIPYGEFLAFVFSEKISTPSNHRMINSINEVFTELPDNSRFSSGLRRTVLDTWTHSPTLGCLISVLKDINENLSKNDSTFYRAIRTFVDGTRREEFLNVHDINLRQVVRRIFISSDRDQRFALKPLVIDTESISKTALKENIEFVIDMANGYLKSSENSIELHVELENVLSQTVQLAANLPN